MFKVARSSSWNRVDGTTCKIISDEDEDDGVKEAYNILSERFVKDKTYKMVKDIRPIINCCLSQVENFTCRYSYVVIQ
jgi:hypothetical protein